MDLQFSYRGFQLIKMCEFTLAKHMYCIQQVFLFSLCRYSMNTQKSCGKIKEYKPVLKGPMNIN